MAEEVKEPEEAVLTPGKDLICGKDNHKFVIMRNGDQQLVAECTKCTLGYPIGPGTEIKDGSIFIHGQKIL